MLSQMNFSFLITHGIHAEMSIPNIHRVFVAFASPSSKHHRVGFRKIEFRKIYFGINVYVNVYKCVYMYRILIVYLLLIVYLHFDDI